MTTMEHTTSEHYLVIDPGDDQADVRAPRGEPEKVVGEVGIHVVVDQARLRWATLWMAVNNTNGQRVRLRMECGAESVRLQDGHVVDSFIQLSGPGRFDTRQRKDQGVVRVSPTETHERSPLFLGVSRKNQAEQLMPFGVAHPDDDASIPCPAQFKWASHAIK